VDPARERLTAIFMSYLKNHPAGRVMDFGLSGKVILVTGGASGIGRACALMASRCGAHVAVVDTSIDQAREVAEEIRAIGVRSAAEILDVRDGNAAEQAVSRIEDSLGPIHGMIACAGTSKAEPAELMSDEAWATVLDVNLTGMFKSIRPVGKRMIERRVGSIVTISSGDGLGGHAGRANYAASKHGVIGLSRSLAIEWGRHGVRVNAVAPGVVDTPLLRRGVPLDNIEGAMLDRVPLGRFSTPEEQGSACLFLLSDAASYINGAVLCVDGGLTAGYLTRWNGADYGSNTLLQRGVYKSRS
jgi:NAD(P)-dependent dehydrogenase (short-subunit alcohol dehydrogenase family)